MHPDDVLDSNLEKARAFFARAEEVALTDNFDYAIQLYLDGLKFSPDAVEDGHIPLRKLALIRQGKNGKKPSIVEMIRYAGGKTPLQQMLNAEYLLAKDPDNLGYAQRLLKAAVAGGYHRTGQWIAELVFQANRASSKPSLKTYLLLKDMYAQMGLLDRAVLCCQLAAEMNPQDELLATELRDLCAKKAMQDGKYEQARRFTESVKDKEVQDQLHSQQAVVKSAEYRKSAVELARQRLEKQGATLANILNLADALADLQTDDGYQQAFGILDQAYQKSNDFTYRRRRNELMLRQMREKIAGLERQVATEASPAAAEQLEALKKEYLDKELQHYTDCVANYPTEMRYKYELGRCLFQKNQYDQAIPLFQEAQKDPKLQLFAQNLLGLCFLLKGWHEDAIAIFQEALKIPAPADSPIVKDITYNLARTYEDFGKIQQALELYRQLARVDFRFKDVSQRIDNLRKSDKR